MLHAMTRCVLPLLILSVFPANGVVHHLLHTSEGILDSLLDAGRVSDTIWIDDRVVLPLIFIRYLVQLFSSTIFRNMLQYCLLEYLCSILKTNMIVI